LLKLDRSGAALVELTLQQGSTAVGKPMYELRLPLDSAIVAIVREGHVVIPQPETVLVAGDEIMAIAKPEAEEELRKVLE
jgi:trk system potassium uptake protein TrkA